MKLFRIEWIQVQNINKLINDIEFYSIIEGIKSFQQLVCGTKKIKFWIFWGCILRRRQKNR